MEEEVNKEEELGEQEGRKRAGEFPENKSEEVGFQGFSFILAYFYALLGFYSINEFIWGLNEGNHL